MIPRGVGDTGLAMSAALAIEVDDDLWYQATCAQNGVVLRKFLAALSEPAVWLPA